jgi:putative DNA primase/helicase
LLGEADGILGWMIEGCAEWQRLGLAPPARVRDASEAYLAEEDLVGQWIEQCCNVGSGKRQSARDLYGNWAAFAREAGVEPGSQKALGEALLMRGFLPAKIAGGRGWLGLSLRHARTEAA